MRSVRVALEEQRAGRFQDATELFQTRAQELDVFPARFPFVAEFKLGRAVARHERVHLLREEWRVNIDQVHRLAGQAAHHFQTIAMTDFTGHVAPSFLRPDL